jgi:CopG family transcriptional regulator, nickel-responsive regulator
MQRFTISLDDALAAQFDALIAAKGYINRSEAVRDLIRSQMDAVHLNASKAPWCVATISYVYDHHDRTVAERVQSLQHEHHDLVITSQHTLLDHDHCLETVVLRGLTKEVQALAQLLIALRGVRHGSIQMVPLDGGGRKHTHPSADGHSHAMGHTHLRPIS